MNGELFDCLECEGTGKVEKIFRLIQEANREQAYRKLIEISFADGALNDKTDWEIAELIINHYLPEVNALSPFYVLLSQCVDRLERSGGGVIQTDNAT